MTEQARELAREKIRQAKNVLKEKNVELWLTFVRESSAMRDPALEMLAGFDSTWISAFLVPAEGESRAIIGSLEVPAAEDADTFERIVGYEKSIRAPFLDYLKERDPKTIAINYSLDANLADGLTHGMYLKLMELLEGTPYAERLVSSEEIVATLRGRKSDEELRRIKKAIEITEGLFDEVEGFIEPGKTEREIAAFLHKRVDDMGLETAWGRSGCPAVFTGPDTAGAHAEPTDRRVERGHILNMDFGVKFEGYCSDMQRTWYVLEEGETEAPPEVERGFQTLLESIERAFAAVKPGAQGCEVDDAARNFLIANNYPEYPHGLGHQVGRVAHDGGAGLFPRWERYGALPFIPLEERQVFTIEPRLPVEKRGTVTMEEMIVITADGAEYLSHPQKALRYIR
ncbi:MAG: M24 family metallopeptidase [Ignavibacteriales bacterium]|nr:M24 family metallopeptidase [Ignavibacteriales bacterium]